MPFVLLSANFFQKLLAWLNDADRWLFFRINTGFTHPFFDNLFPWWREANAWIPLYLFLMVFMIINFKQKAFIWILFVVITLTLTDQINSTFIKNWVARPRPCQDELIFSQVRLLLNHCSGGYSFPSSHATNHFGFAMFVFLTLKPVLKKWGYLFFVWAASICYGQVYVGVHYPSDVFCGAILGMGIGYLTAQFFIRKTGALSLNA